MYKSFEIKNFRCFEDFRIVDLQRINLITGKNNVGKTALMEALFLHSGTYNINLTQFIHNFRNMNIGTGKGPATFWDALFSNFDDADPIKLVGGFDDSVTQTMQLRTVREVEELTQIATQLKVFVPALNTLLTSESGR